MSLQCCKIYNVVQTQLMAHLARHGVPDIVVSDNRPQLSSTEFDNFFPNSAHLTTHLHHMGPTTGGTTVTYSP